VKNDVKRRPDRVQPFVVAQEEASGDRCSLDVERSFHVALLPRGRIGAVVARVAMDEPLVRRESGVGGVAAEVVVGDSDRPVARRVHGRRERLDVVGRAVDPRQRRPREAAVGGSGEHDGAMKRLPGSTATETISPADPDRGPRDLASSVDRDRCRSGRRCVFAIQTSSDGTFTVSMRRRRGARSMPGRSAGLASRTPVGRFTAGGSSDALGYTALRDIDLEFGYGQITYWVRPRFRRRGLATEAARALADWAVSDIGLHRLEIRHSTANAESCQVALRAGFNLEGTARSALRHADGWHDMHVHVRLGTKG
jgi:RimJ/RimL family protein N-acetyltransferase